MINKYKGKERGDAARRARNVDIAVGDKVLIKNVIFPNKLTPNFDSTEFEVIERNGSELKLANGDKILRRNISHVKKIPEGIKMGVEKEPAEPMHSKCIPSADSISSESTSSTVVPGEENDLKLKLKKVGGMWQLNQ